MYFDLLIHTFRCLDLEVRNSTASTLEEVVGQIEADLRTGEANSKQLGIAVDSLPILRYISSTISSIVVDPLAWRICISFCFLLIRRAVESATHMEFLQDSFQSCLRCITNALSTKQCSAVQILSVSDPEQLVAVIRSYLREFVCDGTAVLSPTSTEEDIVADVLLQCFADLVRLRRIDADLLSAGLPITYVSVVGPPLSSLSCHINTLFLEIFIVPNLSYTGRNLTVAVFDCSLEFPLIAGGGKVELQFPLSSKSASMEHTKSAEHLYLQNIAEIFVRSGVTLLVCQKRLHPQLQRMLKSRGVVCLPRVSIRYIGAFCRLTGAKQLSSISCFESSTANATLPADCLGFLYRLDVVCVHGRDILRAEGFNFFDFSSSNREGDVHQDISGFEIKCNLLKSVYPEKISININAAASRMGPMVTVFVTAYSERTVARAKIAYDSSFRQLRQLLTRIDPLVVDGNGQWLNCVVNEFSTSSSSKFAERMPTSVRIKWLGGIEIYKLCCLQLAKDRFFDMSGSDREADLSLILVDGLVQAIKVATDLACALLGCGGLQLLSSVDMNSNSTN